MVFVCQPGRCFELIMDRYPVYRRKMMGYFNSRWQKSLPDACVASDLLFSFDPLILNNYNMVIL
jgi:hypothetical protein